jgi:hypothetical protein
MCRLPCSNFSSCNESTRKDPIYDYCIEEEGAPVEICESRIEDIVGRVHTCLWEGELHPTSFNKGGCALREERGCSADSCPPGTQCDPNGMCRMPCETEADCIPSLSVFCELGLCYDLADLGYKELDVDGGTVYSPDLSVSAEFGAGSISVPTSCALARLDEIYDPSTLWQWDFATLGWYLECHDAGDDHKLLEEDEWGPATIEFDPSSVVLPEGIGSLDFGLCGFNGGQCDRAHELDSTSGRVRVEYQSVWDEVVPSLVEHVDAHFGDDSIECAILPIRDWGSALSFSSAPPSAGLPHFADCWGGSFEFRVLGLADSFDGEYDLSQAETWDTFEISATVDDVLYGVKEGNGEGAGSSGSLHFVRFPTVTGLNSFARLTDVTLVSSQDPSDTILISQALLIEAGQ